MSESNGSQLLPPPPPDTVEESLAAYFELLDLGDAFLRAGLRNRFGPDVDIEAAYREWNREHIERAAEQKVRDLQEALCSEVGDVR
jgi:hypothetical protein